MRRNKLFISFAWYGDHTYRVFVPGARYLHRAAVSTAAAVVYSRCTSFVLLFEKGDAAGIEPRPPFPSTCRLCTRSSRTLF